MQFAEMLIRLGRAVMQAAEPLVQRHVALAIIDRVIAVMKVVQQPVITQRLFIPCT